MMDAKTIQREAARAGFRASEFERVARLTNVLSTLMQHPFLRTRIALKGGTALNIYHRQDVPRLSVDGDLNYIGQVERDATEAEIPRLWQAVEAVAKELDYAVSLDSHGARFRTYRLSYTNCHGSKDSLKLDLNLTERVPVLLPFQSLMAPTLFGTNGPVTCFQIEEIAGMKVTALVNRGAARDFWDVATLPAHLDRGRVRKIALFYGLQYDAALSTWADRIANLAAVSEREFSNDVKPLLRQDMIQSPTDLLEAARAWTVDLLPLTDVEQGVVDKLRDGSWNPDAWFEGTWHNPLVARHPGILKAMYEAAKPKKGN